MNSNTSTIDTMATDTAVVDPDEAPVFEKGTWQEALHRSSNLLDRAGKARKQASTLLWTGAKTGIEQWLPESDTDVSAEGLYAEVIVALGKERKGDASKIKTVATAVRNHGLDLNAFPNLSKAYAEANRLTKTVQQQADEDSAADKAIEAIADHVPNSTTTVDGAALILLSKGVDGAVVAILDALGADNEAAHRAFMRAVSTEIAARVQAKKPAPAPKAGPKAGATQAKPGAASGPKAVQAKSAKTKGKPATKGKPVAKATAAKAEVADKGEAVVEPVEAGVEHEVGTPEVPVKRAARKPVRRRATAVSGG